MKLLRYNVVGVINTVTFFLIIFLFVQFLHWPPVFSTVVAFFIVASMAFVLSYYWVFPGNNQKRRIAIIRFFAVSFWGLLLNTGIMYLVVHILVWPYYFGMVFSTCIVPFNNFMLHHFWSFRGADPLA